MNYTNIYDKIIERAKSRLISGYSEKHHVIPKCLGGRDIRENLVRLTAREHYIVHLLLTKMYPGNISLIYAFWMMSNKKWNKGAKSSRYYEEAKKIVAATMRAKVGTPEARKKMSESKKGQDHWTGRKHSTESKRRQSESAKIRKITEQGESKRREGISKAHSRKLIQKDLKGNFIKEWDSFSEAAKFYNTNVGTLSHACQKKRVKTHKGFIWDYKT